jgi:hypothetical protein
MDIQHLGGTLIGLVAIILTFGTPIILVASILYYRMKRARLLHQTIVTMVEKGVPVPPELLNPPKKPGSDLRTGIVLIAVGLGLTIFLAATAGRSGAWGIGIIPLLLGAGFVITWRIESSNRNREEHR